MNFTTIHTKLITYSEHKHGLIVGHLYQKSLLRGIFNSTEMLLPTDHEEAVFVIVHALGHVAQWTQDSREYEYSFSFQAHSGDWTSDELLRHYRHELDSLPYSVALLNQLDLSNYIPWFLEYFHADQVYMDEIMTNHLTPSLLHFKRILKKVRLENPKVFSIESVSFPRKLIRRSDLRTIKVL